MSRYVLQAPAESFDSWRAAAKAAGAASLAAWIRGVLDATAARRAGPRLESHAVMGDKVFDMHTGEQVQTLPSFRPSVSTNQGPYERSFRPDFRPTKKGGKA